MLPHDKTGDLMTDGVRIKKQQKRFTKQRTIEGMRQKQRDAYSSISSPAITSVLISQNLTPNLVQQGPTSHTADIQLRGCSHRSFNKSSTMMTCNNPEYPDSSP